MSVIAPISSNLQRGDMFYRLVLHHNIPEEKGGDGGSGGGARPEIRAPPPPLWNPPVLLHQHDSKTVTLINILQYISCF